MIEELIKIIESYRNKLFKAIAKDRAESERLMGRVEALDYVLGVIRKMNKRIIHSEINLYDEKPHNVIPFPTRKK